MKKKKQSEITIYGEYNRLGFEVVATRDMKVLEQYRNGNTAWGDYYPADHIWAQPLRVIKQNCEETAKEMAHEWQGEVVSVKRVKEDEL